MDPYFLLLFCWSLKFTLGSLLGPPEFGSHSLVSLLLPSSPSNLSMIASPSSHLSLCQESQETALAEFLTSPCRPLTVTPFVPLLLSFATSSSLCVHPFFPSSVFRFFQVFVYCGLILPADFLFQRELLSIVHSFLWTSVQFVLLCCPLCCSRLLQLMLRYPLVASQVAVLPVDPR